MLTWHSFVHSLLALFSCLLWLRTTITTKNSCHPNTLTKVRSNKQPAVDCLFLKCFLNVSVGTRTLSHPTSHYEQGGRMDSLKVTSEKHERASLWSAVLNSLCCIGKQVKKSGCLLTCKFSYRKSLALQWPRMMSGEIQILSFWLFFPCPVRCGRRGNTFFYFFFNF